MTVRRLTKDYYDPIFKFYNSNKISVVSDEQFKFWLKNLEDLKQTNKTYFYNKYEFFVNGEFKTKLVKPYCSAILKRCKNYSAIVKGIIIDEEVGTEFDKKIGELIKLIEAYCAETGIRTVDFVTNTFNKTSNYFINNNQKYFLLYKKEIDTKTNYEYIFRRNILIDYFGDTTNWRDLCLWFLESVYLPFPSQQDLPNSLTINNQYNSFLNLKEFQSGNFEHHEQYDLTFSIIGKNVNSSLIENTKILFDVHIFNLNVSEKVILNVLETPTKSDIKLLFTIKRISSIDDRIRNITWEDVIKQIAHIQQYYKN